MIVPTDSHNLTRAQSEAVFKRLNNLCSETSSTPYVSDL